MVIDDPPQDGVKKMLHVRETRYEGMSGETRRLMLGFVMAKPDPIAHELPNDAALKAAVEEGIASLDAGRAVPYEDVRRWLLSWGTENEQSAPECP